MSMQLGNYGVAWRCLETKKLEGKSTVLIIAGLPLLCPYVSRVAASPRRLFCRATAFPAQIAVY